MLSSSNNDVKGWIIDFIFLAMTLGILYAICLGSYPLMTPDEGRYSEVAREMVSTGDYITPRLNGVVFLDKPILYYWLQASAINLFGLKEWALRFWPAVIGVWGCLVTYFAGRQLFNRKTGILAAFILATGPLYFGAAHYANLDLEVAVFVSCSLLFFIVAIQKMTSSLSTPCFLLAYIFAALAFLTKGLVGIAFPALIIGTWILITNQWNIILKMRLLLGALLFISISAPWYFLVQKSNPQFFEFFFITQQFSRFLTKGDFNNQSVLWFYIPIIIIGFIPWTLFLSQAIYHQIKLVWQNKLKHQKELFLLLWAVIIFTFFSIPKSKTIGYIIPILPALSLIIANYFDAFWNTSVKKISTTALIVGTSLLVAGLIFLLLPFQSSVHFPIPFIKFIFLNAAIFLIASVIIYQAYRHGTFAKLFYISTTISCSIVITLIMNAVYLNSKTTKPLATLINSQIQPDDEVVTYFRYYQDLPIYLQRRITIVANWQAEDIVKYDNWQRELWFGMPYQNTNEWLIENPEFIDRWHSNKRLFVLMHKDFYKNFAKNVKGPIYILGSVAPSKKDSILLISNQIKSY